MIVEIVGSSKRNRADLVQPGGMGIGKGLKVKGADQGQKRCPAYLPVQAVTHGTIFLRDNIA